MLVYRTESGVFASSIPDGPYRRVNNLEWDQLFTEELLVDTLQEQVHSNRSELIEKFCDLQVLPPLQSQEVWAAGVTYQRSKAARMEESTTAGGSNFYDSIYHATRPELFFKATPHRVVGDGGSLHLRSDSQWIVPEPELTLAFNSSGNLIGYTIGNDLSCRDIEAENPLYLPQAKTFGRCAALGPALRLTRNFPAPETVIELQIKRNSQVVFSDATSIAKMKQTFENLQAHLVRDNSFPAGCYLMTGTGIVPPDDFTLEAGDQVAITIEAVGTLTNTVDRTPSLD